jgi:hypothetical protein
MLCSATIRGTYQFFVVCAIATAGILPLACSTHDRDTSVFLLNAAIEHGADDQGHDCEPGFAPQLFTLSQQVQPMPSLVFYRRCTDDCVAVESILAATHLQRGPPLC